MKIWVTRHGQTRLNLEKRMQGLSDEPLNETGRRQAREAREKLGEMTFDRVYSSPLNRAVETAEILAGISREQIRMDARLTEVDFGKYEQRKYTALGPAMSLYWALPELFPCPKTVERIPDMIRRSEAVLADIRKEAAESGAENILIVCHGGIIRVLCGILEGRRKKIKWRPKPHNLEMRIYETDKML